MAIDGPSRDNVELGKHGRSRTNGAMQALTPSVPTARRSLPRQPTAKPVVAIADAVRDVTKRNDLVLDPFSGSGTTLIAAKKTGKRARAVEIDCHCCDLAIRRWEVFTGKAAVLSAAGETFEEVAE
jgi:DNA modification methylase